MMIGTTSLPEFITLTIINSVVWWVADDMLQRAKKDKNWPGMVMPWVIIFFYPILWWTAFFFTFNGNHL